SLIPELLLELLIRQRPPQVAQRTFNESMQHLAVLQFHFNIRLIFRYRCITDRRNPITNALDQRIIRRGIVVFVQPGLTAHETRRGAVVDGILAIETLTDLALVAQVEHKGRNAHPHTTDRFRRWMIVPIDIDAAVDGWMHDDARRIRLVRVVSNMKILSETGSNLREIVL